MTGPPTTGGVVSAPRVSAVVPTCDRPALLARALRSIAAQDTAPAEVIVVDDGSPLHAEAVRRSVGASQIPDIQLVTTARAAGPSGARNAGAARATGDLLAFLDDDDEWLPAYLTETTRLVVAHGLDVVLTDLQYRYDDGHEQAGKSAPAGLVVDDFLTRNPGLIGSNLVIRRALYHALGGFDDSLHAAEDMDFGIRLSLHPSVRYAPLRHRLVRHFQHRGTRLCTPRGDAMRRGIRRFYELHASRMTEAQRSAFRTSVRKLWGFDELGCDTA